MKVVSDRPFLCWKILLLCFLGQNLAMGFAFGSFGPLLASTEQHFGVSRAVATTGMSLITLVLGVLSPLMGGLLQKVSVRAAMIAGALLSAIGYWGLATLPSFELALLMYGLIGTGVCLTAVLGPLTLINRWFSSNRAKMLAIVNLPIALFVTPFLVAELLPKAGRFAIMGGIGTAFLILVALLLMIVDDPAQAGQRPHGAAAQSGVKAAGAGDPALPTRAILSNPSFWLLSIAIGIMAGSGTVFVVHIVPFGMEQQMSLQSASGLLSVYAGAGIAGTLLFGWIADRFSPPVALILSTSCQAVLWWGILQVAGPPLFLLSALLGICVVPLTTLHGAALSDLVGPATISRAMGFSYAIKLPFLFTFAPAAGYLFEISGGYHMPFLIIVGLLTLASIFFVLMAVAVRRRGRIPAPVPAH